MEKEITARVSKVFKKGKLITSDETEVETVAVVRLDPEAAYATVSTDRTYTKNLGNFSSAKIGVFLSVPSPLEENQIEQAYEFVSDFCETKLAEKLRELDK